VTWLLQGRLDQHHSEKLGDVVDTTRAAIQVSSEVMGEEDIVVDAVDSRTFLAGDTDILMVEMDRTVEEHEAPPRKMAQQQRVLALLTLQPSIHQKSFAPPPLLPPYSQLSSPSPTWFCCTERNAEACTKASCSMDVPSSSKSVKG